LYYAGKITTAFAFVPIGIDDTTGNPLYKAWKSDTFLPHTCSALQNPDSYLLIDPAEQARELPLVPAHTCIAASPNVEYFKGLQKAKQELQKVFLPIWTEEEVTTMYKKLTELKVVHESITAEVFATRLRKFGPIPRYLFGNLNYMHDSEFQEDIEQLQSYTVKKVIKGMHVKITDHQSGRDCVASSLFGYDLIDSSLPIPERYFMNNKRLIPLSSYEVEQMDKKNRVKKQLTQKQ